MIEKNYIALIEEQCKNRTPEMQNAIKEQTRLSMRAEILQHKRDELEKNRAILLLWERKNYTKNIQSCNRSFLHRRLKEMRFWKFCYMFIINLKNTKL